MKPGRNLRVALCLSCPNTTSAEKAQTSLLRLAAANVRRKAVLRIRTASEQTFIGWGGCLMRKRRTRAKNPSGSSPKSPGTLYRKRSNQSIKIRLMRYIQPSGSPKAWQSRSIAFKGYRCQLLAPKLVKQEFCDHGDSRRVWINSVKLTPFWLYS